MKKILIAYDTMMTGGTTTALLSLLNELDYDRVSVDLILFMNEGPFLKDIPHQVNLLNQAYVEKDKKLSVSKEKIIRTVLNGNAVRAVFSYIKHKNTPKGNLRNILMHYGIKSQVDMSRKISQEYDAAIGFIEGWSDQYILSNKVKAKATNIVVVARSCETNIRNIFPEYADKVRTIENINSVSYIQKRAAENTPTVKLAGINFCTVARCDMDVKGLDRILTTLKKIKDGGQNDFLWHYIGDGRDFKLLEDKIDALGLQNNVICYGQMNNPLIILKQMDFFVLASRYEGKPVSVTEAMALNIPCIVTAYASAREQVANGENGLVTDNSEEGIYKAFETIFRKPELRDEYRSNMKNISNQEEIQKLYKIL